MLFKIVPRIDPRYWAALTLASVFGANTGDFAARTLHLGHVSGLPYLAAIFVVILLAERFSAVRWEGWYWLAIITVRTAATNLADLTAHDAKLGAYQVAAALLVVLVVLLLVRRAVTGGTDTSNVPRADLGYWLAMLTAGTLGTALADGLAGDLSLPTATALTGIAVALALGVQVRQALPVAASYWLAVVAIRTFGTNLGDLTARTFGLLPSTLISGLALLALLGLWRPRAALAPSAA